MGIAGFGSYAANVPEEMAYTETISAVVRWA